jgi:creatinine amidohydrolase/Fe(II)-dependent formamide hydrolase-like protein
MTKSIERNIARMTWVEVRDLDKTKAALVLPLGSLEQHGPHLSVDTDLYFSERFLELALERLTADVKVYRLPMLPISKSNEHVGFPGSFWLSAATLTAVVQDIAASAQASGFRRLVLWNCHGGNRALLEVLARDVRALTGLIVFQLFPPAVAPDPLPVTEAEAAFGIHAGDWETSVMLALSPDRVRPDRVEAAYPEFAAQHLSLEFTGATVAWLTRDFQPTGTWGDATVATAERGRIRVEKVVERLQEILVEIATFELPNSR